MKRTHRFVSALLITIVATSVAGCDDKTLTSIATSNTQALGGNFLDKGTTSKECWGGSRNHWGVMYPENHSLNPIKNGRPTVCVSAGLSRDDSQHGTVAIHEMGHLYLYRLGQVGKVGASLYTDESLTDCFAEAKGGEPAGIHYGCSASKRSTIQSLLKAYPTENISSWCGARCN
ncbi:MAG: hypothetical protein R3A47_04190 [Polyangiales bacterium]